MPEILAENLSDKDVLGSDGAELGSLHNITMDLNSGTLADLIIEPREGLGDTEFELNSEGRLKIPVDRVASVSDHMIVNR